MREIAERDGGARSRIAAAVILAAATALYLSLSIRPAHQPIARMELGWMGAAESYHREGVPKWYVKPWKFFNQQPHLYPMLTSAAFGIFGESVPAARGFGVLCGGITILMIYLMVKSLGRGDSPGRGIEAALWALFYAACPGVIHGFPIIDLDNSLLVPANTLFCWMCALYVSRAYDPADSSRDDAWRAAGVAASFALALWVKITTPPVLAVMFLAAFASSDADKRRRSAFAAALAAGFLAFLASWYVYCSFKHFPFMPPFEYAVSQLNATSNYPASRPFTMISNAVQTLLWFNPFFLILFFAAGAGSVVRMVRTRRVGGDLLMYAGGAVVFGGYIVVGGAISGYPKYVSPAFPLMVVCAAAALPDAWRGVAKSGAAAVGIIAGAAAAQLVAGDVIFLLRYTLKAALVHGTPVLSAVSAPAMRIAAAAAIYGIVFAVCMKYVTVKNFGACMLLFAAGYSVAVSGQFATAGYNVGYNHGLTGTEAATALVKSNIRPGDKAIAPAEIVYYLHAPGVKYMDDRRWTDRAYMYSRIIDPSNAAVAYSVPTNAIDEAKFAASDEGLLHLLQNNYTRKTVGSYTVWIRKRITGLPRNNP